MAENEDVEYKVLEVSDIENLVSLYNKYYNTYEGCEWTDSTTYKRIHQVVTREDSFGLVVQNKGIIIGFVMGYFEQYDDGMVYDLIEIVIAHEYQNKNYGTLLMCELEKQVKALGGFMIQLTAVNDIQHNEFYTKLGYGDCSNLILKSKVL